MASYIIGIDRGNSNDSKVLSTVASIVKKAGNSVQTVGVGPGNLQSASKSKSASGKIAIFIVNGADIGTYYDFVVGIGKYYHISHCIFAFQSWAGTGGYITAKGLTTKKLGRAHDDNFSTGAVPFGKYTTDEYMKLNSDKISYVYGDNAEELGQKIVGGTTESDGSNTESSGERNPLLSGDKTFAQIIKEICDATDTLFLVKKSTILITDVTTLYTRAMQIEENDELKRRNSVKFWQMEDESYKVNINQYAMYNTVYIKYNNGTYKEYHEDLVRIFGEKKIVYNEGNIDKSSAIIKAKSYLAHHTRDFGMTLEVKALHHAGYDIGDLLRMKNPLTNANREEIFFVSGVKTEINAESGILSSDLELKFGPANPDNPQIDEVGFSGKITVESGGASEGEKGLGNTSSGFNDNCPLSSAVITKAKSLGSAKSIFNFMRSGGSIKWSGGSRYYEGYRHCPDRVLSQGWGNCMDQARTSVHLLKAIGTNARVIRAPNIGRMGHFHVEVDIDGGKKIFDPVKSSMSQL